MWTHGIAYIVVFQTIKTVLRQIFTHRTAQNAHASYYQVPCFHKEQIKTQPSWSVHLPSLKSRNWNEQALSIFVIVIVQLLSQVRLFATPWTVAHQPSLSFSIFWSLLKLMSIESVMSSNHLILCHPLLLLPSVVLSIRVFSNKSALCLR